jgi:hypothetical protein
MFKFRSLAGALLIVTVLFAQVGTVFAAPPAQETTPITGTVTAVDTETDSNGVTTAVVVTLDTGTTYRISVDTAVALGLATVDTSTNEVTLIDLSQSTEPVIVTIDPATVIPDAEEPEEPVHPIAKILATFFGEDPTVINDYHEDGFGFGVIAQALWIAQGLEEDNADITAGLILQAKRDKDFSAFVLPDGSVPTNWGQFKNAALGKDKKNLGIIVSGHAEIDDDTTTEGALQQQHGNGKDKNKNKEHGNGNGHGNPNHP